VQDPVHVPFIVKDELPLIASTQFIRERSISLRTLALGRRRVYFDTLSDIRASVSRSTDGEYRLRAHDDTKFLSSEIWGIS